MMMAALGGIGGSWRALRTTIWHGIKEVPRIRAWTPLDIAADVSLNILTLRFRGIAPHAAQAPPHQDRRPATAQRPQPAPREGARRAFPLACVLRSLRYRPSQVRDAAMCSQGRRVRQRERRAVRADPANLVPGAARLRRRRAAGAGARQAGSETGPQAWRGGGRGVARGQDRAAGPAFPGPRGTGSRPLRAVGSSAQRRTRPGARKK